MLVKFARTEADRSEICNGILIRYPAPYQCDGDKKSSFPILSVDPGTVHEHHHPITSPGKLKNILLANASLYDYT